jgi:hypothetical protein
MVTDVKWDAFSFEILHEAAVRGEGMADHGSHLRRTEDPIMCDRQAASASHPERPIRRIRRGVSALRLPAVTKALVSASRWPGHRSWQAGARPCRQAARVPGTSKRHLTRGR